MKVVLTFKTPDVVDYALEDLSGTEVDAMRKFAKKFIEYDEYVYIELDTDAGTATVKPCKQR